MSEAYAVQVRDLSGRNVEFRLGKGECYWIRGGNGSGKTTVLVRLVDQLRAQGRSYGYVPQLIQPRLLLPFTLGDVLALYSSRAMGRQAVLDFGLLEPRHLTLAWNTASGGERARTLVMAALLGAPEVLCLDEPLNHLDDDSRDRVGDAIEGHLRGSATRNLVIISHLALPKALLSGRRLTEIDLSSGEQVHE